MSWGSWLRKSPGAKFLANVSRLQSSLPVRKPIPTEAGRRKGSSRSPLTHRLDFEIRRAGRRLGEEAWSGYCQAQRFEGQGSREGAGKGRGERRERREKAGRQREGVLG